MKNLLIYVNFFIKKVFILQYFPSSASFSKPISQFLTEHCKKGHFKFPLLVRLQLQNNSF